MKKWCFVFFASSGFALLPPLAQGIREIQTLLSDSRLYGALGSAEIIQEIVRNETGYMIVTPHYVLQADIHYLPLGKVGPAKFEFEFRDALPR